ncbi:MAG: hypothetical protein EBR34_14605 [Sphingomonadaceae bacterium]|nr:hypothetical protein [Sphingomonadaceae bacterium]
MPEIFGAQPVCGPNGGSVPVTLDGGSVTISSVTVPTNVTVGNTNAAPVPVSDAGGTLSVDDGGGSITVDGPLTDTQLRATALPVSGPLTDSQLRATAVPVTGGLTDTQLRASAVAVSGPLTDTQLRASAVPVVATVAARTPITTSVTGTASSSLLLAFNANRKGLMISNVSSSKLYLSFSNPATVANSFMEMQPGSFLLLDQQLIVTNAIYGIWSNANGAAQATEFV